jgi:hypothetical protein
VIPRHNSLSKSANIETNSMYIASSLILIVMVDLPEHSSRVMTCRIALQRSTAENNMIPYTLSLIREVIRRRRAAISIDSVAFTRRFSSCFRHLASTSSSVSLRRCQRPISVFLPLPPPFSCPIVLMVSRFRLTGLWDHDHRVLSSCHSHSRPCW